MGKPARARNALSPEERRSSAARGRVPTHSDAWPSLPRAVPGLKGPIEVVRPVVVWEGYIEPGTDDTKESRVREAVDAKFRYDDRRILLSSTLRRPKAWLALETCRYRSRLEDAGLHNVISPRETDMITEALARQHIRSWRREGPPVSLPRYGSNEDYPPLPTTVYEYGTWIRVDRPIGPRVSEYDGLYGECDHVAERIWVRGNLPRAQAWQVLWHERYEARLHESTVGKVLDEDLKETLCDILSLARVVEAHILWDWQERPELYTSFLPPRKS